MASFLSFKFRFFGNVYFQKIFISPTEGNKILSGWGAKEAVSKGVGVGSCGQCFMRFSRSNCSREVQNRISLGGGGAVKTIVVEVVDGKQ